MTRRNVLSCVFFLFTACLWGQDWNFRFNSGEPVNLFPNMLRSVKPAEGIHFFSLKFQPDPLLFSPLPIDGNPYPLTQGICLAFRIENTSGRDIFLQAGPVECDSIEVLMVKQDGSVKSMAMGASRGNYYRVNPVSSYSIPIEGSDRDPVTVYVRLLSGVPFKPDLSVWPTMKYLSLVSDSSFTIGIILGVFILLLFYVVLLLRSLENNNFVYFAIYLSALVFYFLGINGVGLFYLWPYNPWLQQRICPVATSVMIASVMTFTKNYLDLSKRVSWLSLAISIIVKFTPVFAFGMLFLDYTLFMRLGGILAVLGLVTIFMAGIASVILKIHGAGFMLVSCVFVLIGSILVQLRALGLIGVDIGFFTNRGEQVGALIQVVIISFGISERLSRIRKKRNESLQESMDRLDLSFKTKNLYHKSLAMRMRLPLVAMGNVALRALEDGGDALSPSVVEDLAVLHAESVRLAAMVEMTLTFNRIKEREILQSPGNVNLKNLADTVTHVSRYLAAGKPVSIVNKTKDVAVIQDEHLLYLSVYGLVAWAAENTVSGTIILSSDTRDGKVLFSVSFPGERMSSEFGELIKEPIESYDRFIEDRIFGVYISRQIALISGGGFSYDESPEGAEFILEIADASPGLFKDDSGFERMAKFGKKFPPVTIEKTVALNANGTVYIAESNPIVLKFFKTVLEQAGYIVRPFRFGKQLVDAALEQCDADIIFVDVRLPDISAREILSSIRKKHEAMVLPVIFLAEDDMDRTLIGSDLKSVNDFILKDTPVDVLLSRVQTHIMLRQQAGETLVSRDRAAATEKLNTLGLMSASVAHEINNPNNVVLRTAGILEEIWNSLIPVIREYREALGDFSIKGYSSGELETEIPQMLADVRKSSGQIRKIVNDLKYYVRSGELAASSPVNLGTVVDDSLRILHDEITRRNIIITFESGKDIPPVLGVEQQCLQVICNLVDNACKAAKPEGGTVGISVFRMESSGRILLTVADDGIGIKRENMTKVFEPFWTTRRSEGGTGLGLVVAESAMKAVGGSIRLESEAGKGTKAICEFLPWRG